MILNFKAILSKNKKIYFIFAFLYNLLRNAVMFLRMKKRGVIFFFPRKPNGIYLSQYGQDYFLEKCGLLQKNGFFVEVGSNHPIFNSNTNYLEKIYGYRGVSIDALDYKNDYIIERPNTIFIQALVDNSNEDKEFYLVDNVDGWEHQLSSLYKQTTTKGKGFTASLVKIKASPLSELIPPKTNVDILFIDVEGHEFSVLNSLNWSVTKPKVIVIENNGEFYPRENLEDYMENKNYHLYARIGCVDDIYVSK